MKSKSIFRSRLLMTILLTALGFVANAQYGGTASVWVKSSEGTRCINVAWYAKYSTESESKVQENLKREIDREKKYNEEFSSSIYYDVEEPNGDVANSGTASVEVVNKNGNTRYINVEDSYKYRGLNSLEATLELYRKIKSQCNYDEVFYGTIDYEIN